MKDVVILEAFTGYPDCERPRAFRPSPDPVPVPDDFADLIIAKGHAVAAEPKASAPDQEAVQAEKRSRK